MSNGIPEHDAGADLAETAQETLEHSTASHDELYETLDSGLEDGHHRDAAHEVDPADLDATALLFTTAVDDLPATTGNVGDGLDNECPVDNLVPAFQPAEELSPSTALPDWIATTDSSEADGAIHGDIAHDAEHWHQQEGSDTCGIVAQLSVLESLGKAFTEEQLVEYSQEQGWYGQGWGTTLSDAGKIFEAAGLTVERRYGATIDDLVSHLDAGDKVIVAVDAAEYWYADSQQTLDQVDTEIVAGHFAVVIGVDARDPQDVQVILNDSGTSDGRALAVPIAEFENAWQDYDRFALVTRAA